LVTPSGRWSTLPVATAWARGGKTWNNLEVCVDELRERWLSLTRHVIPARAEAEQWTLRADHCFQRVILDAVCEGRWYDHVTGRPAYRHLDEHRLALAVSLAHLLATDTDGRQLLERLDAQSLSWRGKSPKVQHRQAWARPGEAGPGMLRVNTDPDGNATRTWGVRSPTRPRRQQEERMAVPAASGADV